MPLYATPAAAEVGPLTSVGIEPMSDAEYDALVAAGAIIVADLVNEYGASIGELYQTPDGAYHEVYIGDPNRFDEVWLNHAYQAHDPSEVWIRDNGSPGPFVEITDTWVFEPQYIVATYLLDYRGAFVGIIFQDGADGPFYDVIGVDLDKVDLSRVQTSETYFAANPTPLYLGVGNGFRLDDEPEPTTTTERETTTTTEEETTTTAEETTTTAEETTTTGGEETTTTAKDTTTTTEKVTSTSSEYSTTTAIPTTTSKPYTTTTMGSTTTGGYQATTTTAAYYTTTTATYQPAPDSPPQAPVAPAKNETPTITG
ncbi:MAG: hypothetical protein AAF962_25560 [Actinomycetota bacterium]